MSKKIVILLIATTLFGCKKESKTSGPEITITSPVEGHMYANGDSILVAFTISDPDMHSFEYALINTSINDTFASIDETHTHGNVVFSQNFAVPPSSQLKLEVSAEDHSENESSKSVSFHTM
jgi:hypothetical protein